MVLVSQFARGRAVGRLDCRRWAMKGVISGSPVVGRKASSWRGVLMRGVVARRTRSAVLLVAACDAGMARSVVRIALRRSGLVGGVDNGVFRRDMSVMSE